MLEIFVETFLQRRTKRLPETSISLAFLFRLLSQRIQTRLVTPALIRASTGLFCSNSRLTFRGRSSESITPRKSATKTEKMLAVIGDEDTLYIQLHATFALRMKQIERPRRRHIKQTGVLDHTLCPEMQCEPRLVDRMADVVVKLFMSVFVDFAFRAHPDRGRLIHFRRPAPLHHRRFPLRRSERRCDPNTFLRYDANASHRDTHRLPS